MSHDLFALTPPRGDSWTKLPDYEPAPPVELNPWYAETCEEQRDESGCSVYLIESATHYKIGISTDPADRLRALNTAHAEPLALIAVRAGGVALERFLHKQLADYRQQGEWFDKRHAVFQEFMTAQLPTATDDEQFQLSA